jgi:hypothetical protein
VKIVLFIYIIIDYIPLTEDFLISGTTINSNLMVLTRDIIEQAQSRLALIFTHHDYGLYHFINNEPVQLTNFENMSIEDRIIGYSILDYYITIHYQ